MHALSMLLQGQSKLKDAEIIYMRYLYEKHKKDLPKKSVDPRNVMPQSDEDSDMDPPDVPSRKVKFIWNLFLTMHQ